MVNPHTDLQSRRVWLIDRRDHWRRAAERVLEAAGYRVEAWSGYDYPPAGRSRDRRAPDLVVVSSTRVTVREMGLIDRILSLGHPLLVTSGRLPLAQMRALFRAGARDAVQIAPGRESMAELVQETLQAGLPVTGYESYFQGGE